MMTRDGKAFKRLLKKKFKKCDRYECEIKQKEVVLTLTEFSKYVHTERFKENELIKLLQVMISQKFFHHLLPLLFNHPFSETMENFFYALELHF